MKITVNGTDYDNEHDGMEAIQKAKQRELEQSSFIPSPTQNTELNSDEIKLNINTERNGLELIFPTKPDKEILTKLKTDGWRWSNRFKLWWIKDDLSARESAKSFIGEKNDSITV